ncbi:ECF transporter S component [Paenibacillus solisilvae]|uniref:ECF transporter S component n=1 Tax=Paenibacillus solisilvae TaxID=2486751 RepID=A0ABW0VXY9_9BACL
MSIQKQSPWSLSTKNVVVIGIGAVLYGLLSYATNFIPVGGNSLRPAIVILTLIGALFGPLVGFFAGLIGNIIVDLFSGQIWINWDVGNGVIGLFAGFAYLLKGLDLSNGRIKGIHYLWIILLNFAGNVVGLIGATLYDAATGTPIETTLAGWSLPSIIVNTAWSATLGLLLIAAIAKRNSSMAGLEIGK